MQFWNNDFIYKEKKSCPNLPGPMWKSNCPRNPITGCAPLCSNNCNQAFAMTGNVSFTSLWRHFDPLYRIVLIQPHWRGFIMIHFFIIHKLWQVILQSSPRPSHYHHHVWLLVWCSFYGMLCWSYARYNGTHTFQKACVFIFGQRWILPCKSPMDAVFAQSLSYCWIMNADPNWGKWGLQFFRCCSGIFYDLLDESSLRSWSNFGRPATPGKVHHCSKFSPFVDNSFDHGSLEFQSLKVRSHQTRMTRIARTIYMLSQCKDAKSNPIYSRHSRLVWTHL